MKFKIFPLVLLLISAFTFSQQKDSTNLEQTISGLKFRSLGPAFMSGRIADIVIDPNNQNIWYVAVGSGGLWKTVNSGTTWLPLTDSQSFYSTGCITIDPNNSNTIWLGTGENVGGRHIGIGHGIYVSHDGGKTWQDKGLKKSEHLSKIIVNPNNSQEIWVAAQGPLWSSGGERGVYKSTDGGDNWKLVLKGNEWTGATDLLIDPRNEKILYAATWQRHRTVAAYMGGGEGTGIHKSIDGGETWQKLKTGLPKENMGKIGLAISPMKPDVVYAAIELKRRTGGVYKSTNGGSSWAKMSNTVSGGTGPHYYQELIASPHKFDKIFLMSNYSMVSEDGGKTFARINTKNKHVDDHALTFRKDDPNYQLFGCDGGIYESFDNGKTWKFVNNLPITQFYKLAVDDAEPFYNIFGGTQDNNTQGGPSRTFKRSGISNSDWFVLLGGDGHQPATEPGNPNIVYAQWQQGNLNRIDRTTGEQTNIKPEGRLDDPYERFNWDAPILVSSHNPKRLYFASQRVWKSNDRGDSWTPISEDLTKDQERITLPIMGKKQSWDEAWDIYAMSTYNTITSLAESPLDENIIYAGTDDGVLQYTKNGGASWTKMLVSELPGVPKNAFINDIKADFYDTNKAYIVLDNHKYGDYKPYVLTTNDGGKTWRSITNGIPENALTWRIVQDHDNKNLMFLATEYGIYVTINQGAKWLKFSKGLPTIAVRDLAIQKRENDLIAATFGRGFYVLDDYSALKNINETTVKNSQLFKPRTALQYQEINGGTSSQGSSYFTSKNPDYGAVFTYLIADKFKSINSKRKEAEKKLQKAKKDIPFPGWDNLVLEKNESKPYISIIIKDDKGNFVTKIKGPYSKGINRIAWNLKKPFTPSINIDSKNTNIRGRINVKPGTYQATLYSVIKGEVNKLGESQLFTVKRIRENVLKNPLSQDEIDAYANNILEFRKKLNYQINEFNKATKKVKTFKNLINYIDNNSNGLENEIIKLENKVVKIKEAIYGNEAKNELREKQNLTINSRLNKAMTGLFGNTFGPTKLQIESFDIAKSLFNRVLPQLNQFIKDDVPRVEKLLKNAGAPIILD